MKKPFQLYCPECGEKGYHWVMYAAEAIIISIIITWIYMYNAPVEGIHNKDKCFSSTNSEYSLCENQDGLVYKLLKKRQ